MSKGNAEQPTAQVPRGQSSPTSVEVSAEGRQGGPQSPGTPRPQSPVTPDLQDQSENGPQERTATGAASNAPTANNAAAKQLVTERLQAAISSRPALAGAQIGAVRVQ